MTQDKLRDLRLKYNAAYTAYQSCVIAMNECALRGVAPSDELLKNEAEALRVLNEARATLLAAMAEFEQDSS
jgi:hypothetical protein